ncbi:hypothetical protein ADUPG1_013003, partial [Aduncisulcus paluster]
MHIKYCSLKAPSGELRAPTKASVQFLARSGVDNRILGEIWNSIVQFDSTKCVYGLTLPQVSAFLRIIGSYRSTQIVVREKSIVDLILKEEVETHKPKPKPSLKSDIDSIFSPSSEEKSVSNSGLPFSHEPEALLPSLPTPELIPPSQSIIDKSHISSIEAIQRAHTRQIQEYSQLVKESLKERSENTYIKGIIVQMKERQEYQQRLLSLERQLQQLREQRKREREEEESRRKEYFTAPTSVIEFEEEKSPPPPPTKDDFQASSQSTNQTIFDSSDAAITKPPKRIRKRRRQKTEKKEEPFEFEFGEENTKEKKAEDGEKEEPFEFEFGEENTKEKKAEDGEKEEPFEFEFGEENTKEKKAEDGEKEEPFEFEFGEENTKEKKAEDGEKEEPFEFEFGEENTKEKKAEDGEKEEPFEFEFGEENQETTRKRRMQKTKRRKNHSNLNLERKLRRPVQETPTDPRSASKPSGVGSLDDAFSFGASESATKNPVDNTFDGAFGEAFDQIPVSNESTETGKDWFGVFD